MSASLQASLETIRALPAFASLSAAGQKLLSDSAVEVEFGEGQLICAGDVVGERVLVVIEGEARRLAERDGRPFTLERLGAGGIIGLVSLLRAEGCEATSAATAVRALAIPDALVVELIQSEAGFRRWCCETVWLPELHALLLREDRTSATGGSFDPVAWRERLTRLQAAVREIGRAHV